MNQTNQRDQTNQRRDQFEDEIELIDYLRVVWRWKWLIIGGTFLCVLAVAVYGFTRPVVRMYRVSTIVEIDPKAKLDPLDRIKSMIEYGIFNQRILNDLSNLQRISKPESLSFEVAIPAGLNILDIAYKTPTADLGKTVLNSLAKQIEENYAAAIEKRKTEWEESLKNIGYKIELMKKEFELDLAGVRGKIKEYAADIETSREKISIIKDRIDQTKKMLKQAELNSAKLADKRVATTLDSQDETGHANVFLQASAIQQIINYPIELRERIDSLIFTEKAFLSDILLRNNVIKGLEKDIEILKLKHELEVRGKEEVSRLKSEIELMKRDRDRFTGIIIRQPPTASLLPIRYKAKRNAILAGTVGFFFLIFLAFFIEYIKNASKRTQKAV